MRTAELLLNKNMHSSFYGWGNCRAFIEHKHACMPKQYLLLWARIRKKCSLDELHNTSSCAKRNKNIFATVGTMVHCLPMETEQVFAKTKNRLGWRFSIKTELCIVAKSKTTPFFPLVYHRFLTKTKTGMDPVLWSLVGTTTTWGVTTILQHENMKMGKTNVNDLLSIFWLMMSLEFQISKARHYTSMP